MCCNSLVRKTSTWIRRHSATAVLALLITGASGLPFLLRNASSPGDLATINPSAGVSTMPIGGNTTPPIGYVIFCIKNGSDCPRGTIQPVVVQLTSALRDQLEDVQWHVDRAFRPNAHAQVAWSYPVDGSANCTGYALEKRRELIAAGWPPAALLLTTAIAPDKEGHLVLVVRTDQGDLVLDNLSFHVMPWDTLPYRWVARQSETDLSYWVQIAVPSLVSQAQPATVSAFGG